MGFGLRQVLEELRALRRESEAQRARLDILKQEIDLLKKGQKQQNAELEALREELSARSREDRENLDQTAAALRGELDRLAGQNGDLEALIRKRTNQLTSKSEEQAAGLETLRGELTRLGDRSGELDALLRKRINQLAAKTDECAAQLEEKLLKQEESQARQAEDLKKLIQTERGKLSRKQEELKRLLREGSVIRVLVITKRDASNLFIENIVREFLRRKYEVTLFADFGDQGSIRMFSDMGLQIYPASELTAEIAEEYDFIFCAVQSLRDVFLYNRYVFTYYSMNPAIDPIRGSDFTFTWGEEPEGAYDGAFSLMPVGNPKNDTLVSGAEDSGRILFLDSGHFPFSDEGKLQVAQMLLDICARFPDREVWVKPRWLPDMDRKAMTHKSTTHLYDQIDTLCGGRRPKNLTLLMEHLDLQQLIDSSHCVITTVTTAYLDAALRGKGLLIVRGFENEDMYQARSWYFDDYYRLMEDTGCVVDVRDVCDHLPDGILCRPEHLRKTYCYASGVSERIVSVMEDICLRFLRKGTWPKTGKYEYETYRDAMTPELKPSFADLRRRRMNCLLEGELPQRRFLSRGIDWTDFLIRQEKLLEEAAPSSAGYRALKKLAAEEKRKHILAHAGEIGPEPVDRAYLYMALYEQGEAEELLELAPGEQPNAALHYYCGLVRHDRGDWARGAEELRSYAEEVCGRPFLKYHVEADREKRTGLLALCECLEHTEETEALAEALTELERGALLTDLTEEELERLLPLLRQALERLPEEKTAELRGMEARLMPKGTSAYV